MESEFDQRIGTALEQARELHAHANPNSASEFLKACAYLPGGNTRAVLHAEPFPLTLKRGSASSLWDIDGHEYRDFLGDHTAALLGHSDPVVIDAVVNALNDGIVLGGRNTHETRLAELICSRFSSIELVRFTNSGTEANMIAIGAARAITMRSKVLAFEGGFHGSLLNFAPAHHAINAPFDFIIGKYNDVSSTAKLLAAHSNELAAVIVEPMLGSGGCIPASEQFLGALREITLRTGAILIFDEVMTSRLWPGGLQSALGIQPDITTLGKYLGGGLTFGAFGGRAEIMKRFDGRNANAFSHSGTFNNNVLSMAAGVAAFDVYSSSQASDLNARGDRLRLRLNRTISDCGVAMHFSGRGSMLHVHMSRESFDTYQAETLSEARLRELFYLDMLKSGFWIGKRGLMSVSLPVTDADCELLVAAVSRFVTEHSDLLSLRHSHKAMSAMRN